ncbi:MAG: replication initiation protein [Pseudazoarcus pumilus]|nr:replication initiation protein [Pseudazoarcus pumilus]
MTHGLVIRPASAALQHRHLQPNAPLETAWLVFDVDYAGAAYAWEKANLPPPTLTVVNPENAHAHLFYGLATPVGMSNAAREAPIRYAAAIQSALLARLCADPGYAGLIAKNPFHASWHAIWVQHLYDLAELAEYVELPKRRQPRETLGLGRNCTLFDELRAWAYTWVREYKRNAATPDIWHRALAGQAEHLNAFDVPLADSEVKAIAKSVAKWTWRHFSDATFSSIQSARGKRGGRPATTTLHGEPWAKQGVSRATYYRRLKSGLLTPADPGRH